MGERGTTSMDDAIYRAASPRKSQEVMMAVLAAQQDSHHASTHSVKVNRNNINHTPKPPNLSNDVAKTPRPGLHLFMEDQELLNYNAITEDAFRYKGISDPLPERQTNELLRPRISDMQPTGSSSPSYSHSQSTSGSTIINNSSTNHQERIRRKTSTPTPDSTNSDSTALGSSGSPPQVKNHSQPQLRPNHQPHSQRARSYHSNSPYSSTHQQLPQSNQNNNPVQSQSGQSTNWLHSPLSSVHTSSSIVTATTATTTTLYRAPIRTHSFAYNGPFDPRLSDGLLKHDLKSVLGDYHRGQLVTLLYKPSTFLSNNSSGAEKQQLPAGFLKVSFVRPEHALDVVAHNRAAKFFSCSPTSAGVARRRVKEKPFTFVGSGYDEDEIEKEKESGNSGHGDTGLMEGQMEVSCDLEDGKYVMSAAWTAHDDEYNCSNSDSVYAYTLIRIRGGMPLVLPDEPSFSRLSERYSSDWGMEGEVDSVPSRGYGQGGGSRRLETAELEGTYLGFKRKLEKQGEEWEKNRKSGASPVMTTNHKEEELEHFADDNNDLATGRKQKWDVGYFPPPQRKGGGGGVKGFVRGMLRRLGSDTNRSKLLDKRENRFTAH